MLATRAFLPGRLAALAVRQCRMSSTASNAAAAAAAAAVETAAKTEAAPAPLLKITLKRSLIGLHPKLHRTAQGIGLRKRGRSVYQRASPGVVGSVLRLKEVARVERVPDRLARALEKVEKPRVLRQAAPLGFKIVSNVLEQQKVQSL
ncbi:hypothetical protein THASP1DRAFT_29803 [Thamnocephalis sphaerospora]|uniref:Large ribosomal subunit protein uL30m n=1 Tax=Thamnocephalis sphaerospora TaxID=78915 RepID=A0A4P9XQT1_9FUNG|nr:hypothetical protein THASP1DRAFT_29803 [Thamnocephalis sphaerospora]|eukprot:RKP08398.1 hypothetical protein THASP1DRAFT_29803 [Thamnocephalis sphaerospora]